MKRMIILVLVLALVAVVPVFSSAGPDTKAYAAETEIDPEICFKTLQDAADYITEQIESNNRKFSFYYTSKDSEDAIALMRMSSGLMGVYGGEGALMYYSKAREVDGKEYYKYDVNTSYLTKKQLKSAIAEAEKVAKKAKKQSTKTKQYKYINTWMKKNIKFTTKQGKYDTVYGALVKGKADANAYAATYALICHKAGLKCEYVSGNRKGTGPVGVHAWNIIKINRKWYSVDVAANDYFSTNKYFKCTKSNKTFWKGRTLLEEYETKAYKKAHTMA